MRMTQFTGKMDLREKNRRMPDRPGGKQSAARTCRNEESARTYGNGESARTYQNAAAAPRSRRFGLRIALLLAAVCLTAGTAGPAAARSPGRTIPVPEDRITAPWKPGAAADVSTGSWINTSVGTLPNWIILSEYRKTLNIGEEFHLRAMSSRLVLPSFRSSSPRIASVNTYGLVTAKHAGTCRITAKVRGAEASCTVTVRKTGITLNQTQVTLENGQTCRLTAATTNGTSVTWKSSKRSVAEVSETGTVTAKKPGRTVVTASADGTTASCIVTVKKPDMKINHTTLTLHRKQMFQLYVRTSSGIRPSWRSSKSSVATVDEYGMVTAVRHGTCVITATLDGVKRTCEVTVQSPTITLSPQNLTLTEGQTARLNAVVSSGVRPTWRSSNTDVATVDDSGTVKALCRGRAVIYCSEDGAKECCHVQVTESQESGSKETISDRKDTNKINGSGRKKNKKKITDGSGRKKNTKKITGRKGSGKDRKKISRKKSSNKKSRKNNNSSRKNRNRSTRNRGGRKKSNG